MPNPELTIFLISAGWNPNYFDCLTALEAQTLVQSGRAKIEHIYNLAPMSAAFQRMLDACKTPYYMQVDCDMVLEPDAAEVLLDMIQRAGGKLTDGGDPAFAVAMLHDCHLDMPIQGIKLYDHAIMVNYPYVTSGEVISCEVDQLKRLRADGYRIVEDMQLVLGEHSPKWTPRDIFTRYFRLMAKWQQFGYSWLENLPLRLMRMYASNPCEINKFAYLGAAAAISNPRLELEGEDDFRKVPAEYLIARSWCSEPTQATLYLTTKCNLKCGWCLRQGDMACVSDALDFDPDIVDELMVRCPTIKSFCLCGFGETLLHPRITDIIDRCKKLFPPERPPWIGIITNGTLLGQKFGALLEHRPSAISISLNAALASEHEKECGVAGAWQMVMNSLAIIRDWRSTMRGMQSQDRGIPIYLSRVCTVDNLDTVPDFLQLAQDLGVIDGIDLHNILPHDVGTPEKLAEFLGKVLTTKHFSLVDELRAMPAARLVRSWPVLIDPENPVRRCDFPFKAIAIDGNRNISICNSVMPPSPEHGHIRDPKVWRNDYAQAFRESFADETIPDWCKYCFRNWTTS